MQLDPQPILSIDGHVRRAGLGLLRLYPLDYVFAPRFEYSQDFDEYLRAEEDYQKERS